MKKTFKSEFSEYESVETEDGSITLLSKYFDECCHSLSGAIEETRHNYIDGCCILKQIEAFDQLNILEVGFGQGIGLKVTLENLTENHKKLKFISTEIDPYLIKWAMEHTKIDCDYFQFSDLEYKSESLPYYYFNNNRLEVIILIGDARSTIKAFGVSDIHCIYQDAFSPKKNSALWTKNWFSLLKDISNKDCILATYSASASVRKTLDFVGWKIENLKGLGRKRSITRARLAGERDEELMINYKSEKIKILED